MGPLLLSFPADLDLMARDNVDDFGILRTCLRGRYWCCCCCWCCCCYCPLSVTPAGDCTGLPSMARGRSTSARGCSSEMAAKGGRARVRSRERSVAGGWGLEGLRECAAWAAAVAGTRWRAVALSMRLCLLPMVSAVSECGTWQRQLAACSGIKGAEGGTNRGSPGGVVVSPGQRGLQACTDASAATTRDWSRQAA